jgi:hypothetical protein
VIATGFSEKDIVQPQAAASPAQRTVQNTFSRPQSAMSSRQEARTSAIEGSVKSTAIDLNVEELEVPAFMRKPLSK